MLRVTGVILKHVEEATRGSVAQAQLDCCKAHDYVSA